MENGLEQQVLAKAQNGSTAIMMQRLKNRLNT